MKLLLKHRFFSWTDTYDVFDEADCVKYFVKAEFFTFGHVLHVYDTAGNEVGCIREKILTFMPKFEVIIGGQLLGTISKKFTLFSEDYVLDYKGWDVEGDFLGWDYSVRDKYGADVVSVSKEIFNFTDVYSIAFYRSSDELPALLTAIAIDAANCGKN